MLRLLQPGRCTGSLPSDGGTLASAYAEELSRKVIPGTRMLVHRTAQETEDKHSAYEFSLSQEVPMAQSDENATLVKLSDSNLRLADPAEDIRGRKVLDKEGEEIGDVDDMFVDDLISRRFVFSRSHQAASLASVRQHS